MKQALFRLYSLVGQVWRTVVSCTALLFALVEPERELDKKAFGARLVCLPVHLTRFFWGLVGTDRDMRLMMRDKLRRHVLVYLNPSKVEKMLERRRGHCHRCGISCELGFRCAHLTRPDRLCGVQANKPRLCTAFPLDERDLQERVLAGASFPCGYYFVDPGESEEDARRRSAELVSGRVRKEAPRSRG